MFVHEAHACVCVDAHVCSEPVPHLPGKLPLFTGETVFKKETWRVYKYYPYYRKAMF